MVRSNAGNKKWKNEYLNHRWMCIYIYRLINEFQMMSISSLGYSIIYSLIIVHIIHIYIYIYMLHIYIYIQCFFPFAKVYPEFPRARCFSLCLRHGRPRQGLGVGAPQSAALGRVHGDVGGMVYIPSVFIKKQKEIPQSINIFNENIWE